MVFFCRGDDPDRAFWAACRFPMRRGRALIEAAMKFRAGV